MAARPRAKGRREWPTGLSESRPGYFMWLNPITKAYVKIGRVPLADARMQAMEANLWAAGQMGKLRLLDRLEQKDKTVSEWLEEWYGGLKFADNTMRSYRTSIKAISAEIGEHALGRLSVHDAAKALDAIRETRGARTAQACRSAMKAAFGKAIAKGHMQTNPAQVTEAQKVVVARTRFTTESFSKVWAEMAGAPTWLRHAVLLAMLTGLRREDVSALKFSDVTDDHLLVTPLKNQGKVKIAIPLALHSQFMKTSLKEAIAECRRTGVVSQFMVHQTEPTSNSAPGKRISLNTISSRFTEYVVKALGEGKNLPTFHELRSLCKRTYMEQGGVDTKALLGHTTEETAALYANSRGAEFQKVKLG